MTAKQYLISILGSAGEYGAPKNEKQALKELIESHKRQREIIGEDTIRRQKYSRFQWWLVRTFNLN